MQSIALGLLLTWSSPTVALSSCDGSQNDKPERIAIRPGTDIEIEVTAHSQGLLIEEFGGDLQVRAAPDAEFVDISIRPNRLGIAAVRAASKTITVRLNPAHAPSHVIIRTRCAQETDLVFFEALQKRFVEQIEAGAERASAAIPQIEQELAANKDPWQRAWLTHTLANAIFSAGIHKQSSAAFLRARVDWHSVADAPRAAVALLAAAEDLSRQGAFDQAHAMFRKAETELTASGSRYYQLRALGQQCVVLSRRGEYEKSVACETGVADSYEEMGEYAAAGASGISVANQWMKLGQLNKARESLLWVDQHRAGLLPVTRAKLHASFGTYYLQTGELDNAVRELLAASTSMGELGLPAEQANIDLKLADAARRAGAYDEELRLLERSLALLGTNGHADVRAAVNIRAAIAHLYQGHKDATNRYLAKSEEICNRLAKADCIEQVLITKVRMLLQVGDVEGAQQTLDSLTSHKLASSAVHVQLLKAQLHIARSQYKAALSILAAVSPDLANPDVEMAYALLRAQALVGDRQTDAAQQWLKQSMSKMLIRSVASDAAALRASARHRISRLQSALFDLFEPDDKNQLSATQVMELRAIIDSANPLRVLGRSAVAQTLSDDVRSMLSDAVSNGKLIDQRRLFLELATKGENSSTTSLNKAPAPTTSFLGENTLGATVLLPLAGDTRFRLMLLHNGTMKQCLTMSRAEFDTLTLRFESALEGKSAELPALEKESQRWYHAIANCGAPPLEHWNVLASLGTRSIPWAWIATGAGARAAVEPSVSIQFDTGPSSTQSLFQPSGASVLNLNLSGKEALPFAAIEANKVSGLLSNAGIAVKQLDSGNIRIESVFNELAKAGNWVHLIGHGNPTDYGSLYAGLWLPSGSNPTLVAFPEIASATFDANLLVLSACGDAKKDRGFAGSRLRITEAMLAAGVRNVVASSNTASDAAAAVWTSEFSAALLNSGNIAVAARSARQKLRQSPHFRNPKYWAGIEFYFHEKGEQPTS